MLVVFILLLISVSAMEQLPEIVMDRIITCIIVIFVIELPFAAVMFTRELASCRKQREEWQNLNSTALDKRLHDADPAVRLLALDYLAESSAESAFPRVVEMLGDREAEVRRAAAEMLAILLRRRLGEEKAAWTKCLAMMPAGQAPAPTSLGWRRKLEAVFPELRQKTVAALARSGKPSAGPILLEMLDGEEDETPGLAADALAWLVRVHCGEDRGEWLRLLAEE